MKSVLKTKKSKELIYPVLMTHLSYPGSVVLFTNVTTGTVVNKFANYELGYHLQGWERADNGRWSALDTGDSVTLSND